MCRPQASLAFIICSEKGTLEKKSVLFVKSLRKYGGKLKDAPVYSIAPREGHNVSTKTFQEFEVLKVKHEHVILNKSFGYYPIANKIFSCAYLEKKAKEDILVFCDSDQLILQEPAELNLEAETDVAIQLVAQKGAGTNEEDANTNYWNSLYKLLGMEHTRYVQLKSGEKIREYYNAGLIAVKRDKKLFRLWEKNFGLLMKQDIVTEENLFFTDQTTLAASISAMKVCVNVLPESYNFNLFLSSDANKALSLIENNKICTLHYHKTFDAPNQIALNDKLGYPEKTPVLKWINDALISCQLNEELFVSDWKNKFHKLTVDELQSLFKYKKKED